MLTPSMRRRIRRLFGTKVDGTPQGLGYLREFPRLGDFIPLGHSLWQAKVVPVNDEFIDLKAAYTNWTLGYRYAIYAVDANGLVVAKARGAGFVSTLFFGETVYRFLRRVSMKKQSKIKYIFYVDLSHRPYTRHGIIIGKFPPDVWPYYHVQNLMDERLAEQERQRSIAAAEECAEIQTAQAQAKEALAA